MTFLVYTNETLAAITAHVESTYPDEGCGVVLRDPRGHQEVFPLKNVGPASAFVADARDLYLANRLESERGARIVGIFHSHPDQEAYLSSRDREGAVPDGIESYPGAEYLVLSVRKGRAAQAAAFRYDTERREFIRREVELGPGATMPTAPLSQ